MNELRRRDLVSCLAVLAVASLGLAGCSSGGAAAPADDDAGADQTAVDQTADAGDGDEAPAAEDDFETRLMPLTRIKDAVDVRIEGNDAWITTSVESTSMSAILECLHYLPASTPGVETITLIYSDGVEELCEWPEDI